MHAHCSICQETLGETYAPMTTSCGHLYCADCATQHFAHIDLCAICRRGPYEFDDLIKLYPDYECEQQQASSSLADVRESGHGRISDGWAMKTGMSAVDACYDALEDAAVLDSPALGTALDRTDDLVAALEGIQGPEVRTLLSNIMCLLGDIRSKATSERVAADEALARSIARIDELEDELAGVKDELREVTDMLPAAHTSTGGPIYSATLT